MLLSVAPGMEIPLQNPKCTCVSIGLCVECWRRRLGNDVEDRTFLLQLRVRRRGHADICSSGVQSARLCGSFLIFRRSFSDLSKTHRMRLALKLGGLQRITMAFGCGCCDSKTSKIEGRRDIAMTVCCRQRFGSELYLVITDISTTKSTRGYRLEMR